MKLELKRLSINSRMSEETICFVADIWIDGVKVADAQNDGHGGMTFVHWHPGHEAAHAKYKAFIASLPPVQAEVSGKPFSYAVTEDNYIDELVAKHDIHKRLMRLVKQGKTVFRLKTDDEGAWSATKEPVDLLAKRYAGKIDKIFNLDPLKAVGLS